MNLNGLKALVTSKAGRQILTLQKHSPAILFGAGVVGVVGTVVLACKATLKVEDVLNDHNKTMMDIQVLDGKGGYEGPDELQKDKILLYIRTARKFTIMYAPAVLVGALSIVCLTQSHRILTQRNAGLMAAYTALDKGFRAYRERVVAAEGSDKDREYLYGVEKIEVVKEGKNGPKTVIEKRAGEPSIYAKLFGQDYSTSWNPVPEYNLMFLKSNQNWANDMLKARGHLFLNEVYAQLGMEHTKAGAVTGWVFGSGGDDYIDFGIFNRKMEPEHFDFFTGLNDAIWLDFNVDGIILDLI